MHNIKEFISLENRADNPSEFFKNIKSSIKFQIELLEQNQKVLKETSTAVREVNGLLVSDKIAETNIKLQKSIKWMTVVILILTCITTCFSYYSKSQKQKSTQSESVIFKVES